MSTTKDYQPEEKFENEVCPECQSPPTRTCVLVMVKRHEQSGYFYWGLFAAGVPSGPNVKSHCSSRHYQSGEEAKRDAEDLLGRLDWVDNEELTRRGSDAYAEALIEIAP